MKFLSQLVVSALAFVVASFLFKGVHVDSVFTAIAVAAVLAVLTALVKPILFILTIPITIVTLGLFLLVINAAMIMLASEIVPGFHVSGFWTAFFFSIILTLINSVFNALGNEEGRN